MLIKFKNNKDYLVYGFYNVYGSKIFITYEDNQSPLNFISEHECQILDNTPSKYWIQHDNNTFLPKGWNKTNFLYELVDDLTPLITERFKIVKDKIDAEFSYYFKDNSKELQDSSILEEAEAIGENWVLCPECSEAFSINDKIGVLNCPNIACKMKMNNPYMKNVR